MIKHSDLTFAELTGKIKRNEICFEGNDKLKIYGSLKCKSGKQMKKENRVFFVSETEAVKYGFRPCGHCLQNKYQTWKNEIIQYKKS